MTSNTDDPLLDGERYFAAVDQAIARPLIRERVGSVGLDAATEHILQLLMDATNAFERESYGTAVFLALTALEETAKAELVGYRRPQPEGEKPKGRDPLRDHASKHVIAVRPTVFMSERLHRYLGRERCEAIKAEAEAGGLVALREAAIYVDFDVRPIVTPREAVPRQRAYEMLLVALEAADDILVGYTNRSFEYGKQFEALIEALTAGS